MLRRKGFTLVELLVVIAIIGILVGLLLPAVQAAREAARRSQCQNKMKQLGLAVHLYSDSHRSFPAGNISSYRSGCETTGGGDNFAPWSVLILPYMENQALFETFTLDEPFTATSNQAGSPTNDAAFYQPNPDFQCPSDANSLPVVNNSNYYGVQGGGDISQATCTTSSQQRVYYNNGVLFFNSRVRFKDITDGTSSTFLLGETKYHLSPTGRTDGVHMSWSSSSYTTETFGRPGVLAAAVIPINSYPSHGGEADTLNYMTRLFGSFHPGGCHFTMGDASTQFVTDDIDLDVYRLKAQRSDGFITEGL